MPDASTVAHATLPHGGNLAEAASLFPAAPRPWIDLSTGISPEAFPVPPLPAACFQRLPSPEALARLERAAAKRYGVGAETVIASAGTQPLIGALPWLAPRSRVAILSPTYAEHARAWRLAGHEVVEVATLSAVGTAAAAVVVRPNNPTGEVVALDEIRALHASIAGRGGLLVIDEAFSDFLPYDLTTLSLAGKPGLIVLRSLGKSYGLAGVRLAFGFAESSLVERLRAHIGPWPVSGPAIEIGIAALSDETWLGGARERLARRHEQLCDWLRDATIEIRATSDLFLLVDDPRAPALFRHFGEAGIFTRRFTERPHWLRIGLPEGSEATLGRVRAAVGSFRA